MANENEGGSAGSEWLAKIDDYTSGRETGCATGRGDAARAAAKKYPELQAAVVAEANREKA